MNNNLKRLNYLFYCPPQINGWMDNNVGKRHYNSKKRLPNPVELFNGIVRKFRTIYHTVSLDKSVFEFLKIK